MKILHDLLSFGYDLLAFVLSLIVHPSHLDDALTPRIEISPRNAIIDLDAERLKRRGPVTSSFDF